MLGKPWASAEPCRLAAGPADLASPASAASHAPGLQARAAAQNPPALRPMMKMQQGLQGQKVPRVALHG
jgi:hypothetical protein